MAEPRGPGAGDPGRTSSEPGAASLVEPGAASLVEPGVAPGAASAPLPQRREEQPWVTDHLLDGRLILRQPRQGHRAGTDAILLAAAAAAVPAAADTHEMFLDVGAHVGTVGLIVALLRPAAAGVLVEIDHAATELARDNIRLNNLDHRLKVTETDVLDAARRRAAGLSEGKAGLVITNPPFFSAGLVRASPYVGKANAHVMARPAAGGRKRDAAASDDIDPLECWIRACLALLAPRGRFVMIHRPDALHRILAALQGRLGDITLLPIHPRKDANATRMLIRGVKASRAPLRLRPGLILHCPDGRFSPQAEAIHRGHAVIDWE